MSVLFLKPAIYWVIEGVFVFLAMVGCLLIMGAKYSSWIDYGIVAACTVICALIAQWLFSHEMVYLAR